MSIEHLRRQIKCAALIQDLGTLTLVNGKKSNAQYVIDMALIYMRNIFVEAEKKKINLIYLALAGLYLSNKYQEAGIQIDFLVKKLLELAKITKSDENKIIYYIKSLEHLFLALLGTQEEIHPIHYALEVIHAYKLDPEIITTVGYVCTAYLHYSDFSMSSTNKEIAAVSLYIALKWNFLDLKETKNRQWFQLINPSLKLEKIQELSYKFLQTYHQIPTKLKVAIFKMRNDKLPTNNAVDNDVPCQKRTISKDEYFLKRNITHSENPVVEEKRFKEEEHKDLPHVRSVVKSGETPDNYSDF